MKKILFFILWMTLITSLTACQNEQETESTVPQTEEVLTTAKALDLPTEIQKPTEAPVLNYIIELDIESEAISQNMIGQSGSRSVFVNLPPSYYESDQSYPVVYYLGGYGAYSSQFAYGWKKSFDDAFKEGAKEFILVALDGNSSSGGSFYANSPVSGNWEDYVVEEVVSAIDENFRTIPDVDSRGISGYSMGGFGALYLGLKHPDIFNSVLVFCPGVFAEEDLELVRSSWAAYPDVNTSYGQAFSPNLDLGPDYANLITDEDIETKSQVYTDWISGYSGWEKKIDDYLALEQPLKNISINYSESDVYKWIPNGCNYLSELLEAKDIPYSMREFIGGHIIPSTAHTDYFIPLFNETLVYEE